MSKNTYCVRGTLKGGEEVTERGYTGERGVTGRNMKQERRSGR